MTITDLTIPTGYTHRSELIARGWTADLIQHLLPEFIKVEVPQGLVGVSNKAYSNAEIEAVESSNSKVKSAITALRDRVPATDAPYVEANTYARATLLIRGWTPAHITRLLGPADMEMGWATRVSHRFGKDRVLWAEANDKKLVARLAKVTKDKTKEIQDKEDEIQSRVRSGDIVFRSRNGAWVIEGVGLQPGTQVVASKKNGAKEHVWVGDIITIVDDMVTAHIGRRPAPEPAPAAPVSVAPVTTPSGPIIRSYLALGRVNLGQVLRVGQYVVTVVSATPTRIRTDDPSMYGSHLYGHEGTIGTHIAYRAASESEAAELIEHEAKETQERQKTLVTQQALRAVETYAQSQGVYPPSPHLITGEVVFTNADLSGVGTTVYADHDNGSMTVKIHYGMDGDNFDTNNVPGGRAWVAPLDMSLIDALTAS